MAADPTGDPAAAAPPQLPPGARGRILRNVGSNYFGFAVGSLATLLLTPFLIGRLGDVEFGTWALLAMVLSYFQLLELGIMPAVVRFVSHHHARGEPEQVAGVIGSAAALLLLLAAVTVPVVVAAVLAGPALFNVPLPDHERFMLATALIGVTAIASYFRRLLFAVFAGHQRFDLLNTCTAAGVVLGSVASVLVVLAGHGLVALILVLLGQVLGECLLEAVLARRVLGLRIELRRASRAHIERLSGYSLYALLIDLAVTISYRIDAVVIGVFLPVAAMTHYTIATKITGMLEKIINPLVEIFFPFAAQLEAAKEPEPLRRLLVEGTRISLLVIAPGVLLASRFGGDAIRLWVGPQYVEPCLPVLWVFLGVVLLSVYESTAAQILLGTGRVRFDAWVSLATAVCNLALSLLLVRHYGLLGVALGTLAPSLLFKVLLAVPFCCRVVELPVVAFHVRACVPAAVVVAGAAAWMAVTDLVLAPGLLSFLVQCAGTTVVFAAVAAKCIGREELVRWLRRGGGAP